LSKGVLVRLFWDDPDRQRRGIDFPSLEMLYLHLVQKLNFKVRIMNAKTIREQTVRDAKSNLILDSARKVFSDRGFHETRLEDIALCAGFSKASLYNYFADKEEIFLNLAIRDFEELLVKLRAGMDASAPFISSLEHLLRTVFAFFGEHITFFWEASNFHTGHQFDMHHLQKHHQELLETLHKNLGGLLSTFAEVVHSARERGEIATTVDEMTLARYVAALARGVVFDWKTERKIGDVEQTVKDLLEFVSHGIGHPVLNTVNV
jgi:AcrR family transcriptional regulator